MQCVRGKRPALTVDRLIRAISVEPSPRAAGVNDVPWQWKLWRAW